MMYELIYSDGALKSLHKLENNVQERVIKALERIRIRPYSFLIKLIGYPGYKLRVGDYRVILDIENDKLLILVIKIGHRKNIYKDL